MMPLFVSVAVFLVLCLGWYLWSLIPMRTRIHARNDTRHVVDLWNREAKR